MKKTKKQHKQISVKRKQIKQLIEKYANIHNVSYNDLIGKSRERYIVYARTAIALRILTTPPVCTKQITSIAFNRSDVFLVNCIARNKSLSGYSDYLEIVERVNMIN